MRYELGDKVRIKKHWKRADQWEQLKEMGITDLDDYLGSDDMAGDTVEIKKYQKETIEEVGFVAGVRSLKHSYELMHVFEDAFETGVGIMPEVDEVRQVASEHEKVYLVATRMNCLRRVSFEDIEYIGVIK